MNGIQRRFVGWVPGGVRFAWRGGAAWKRLQPAVCLRRKHVAHWSRKEPVKVAVTISSRLSCTWREDEAMAWMLVPGCALGAALPRDMRFREWRVCPYCGAPVTVEFGVGGGVSVGTKGS